ncbi:MAG TPA: anti-sigma factor [Acidimicrobiales bacterium]|nr:anti-sigma factor [Acidimicrobiales bacterium]
MGREAELHELVGAYALDALESDEADLFERHLDECPKCRAELRDHQQTAAVLAHAGTVAPAGVWERITAELDHAPAPVVPLFDTARDRRRTSIWRRGALAAAVAAAAVIGVNSAVLLRQRDQIARLDPLSASSVEALAERAGTDSSSRVAALRHSDGTVLADVVITDDGAGYLVRGNLPALDADHTYQLWAVTATGQPVSLGVLGRKPVARSFSAQLPIDRLAITVEANGGARAPTSAPLVAGDVVTPS